MTDDDETMSLDGKESAYTVSDSDSDIETDDNQTGNNQFNKLLENQSAKDKPNSNLVFDEENPKVNLLAPPLPQIDYPWNLLPMNEPILHKCQCIHSVVPQLETTLTSQPGQLPMYLPWDYIHPCQSGWPPMYPMGKCLERHWSWRTAYTN